MDIKKIINEEIQPLVNEAAVMHDDRLRFTGWVDAEFWNFQGFSNDYDIDIDPTKVGIKWNINFWINTQGITNFNIEIEGVEGIILVRYLDKQTDEQVQEFQKNLAEYKWNFKVEEGAMMVMGNGLYAREANFDFKNNLCTITF